MQRVPIILELTVNLHDFTKHQVVLDSSHRAHQHLTAPFTAHLATKKVMASRQSLLTLLLKSLIIITQNILSKYFFFYCQWRTLIQRPADQRTCQMQQNSTTTKDIQFIKTFHLPGQWTTIKYYKTLVLQNAMCQVRLRDPPCILWLVL